MPTASSWTDTGPIRGVLEPLRDVRYLIGFRLSGRRGRLGRHLHWLVGAFVLVTVAAAVVPNFAPGGGDLVNGHAFDVFLLLPSAYAGFLVLNVASAVASGGGRELIPRDQAVAYPVSPAVDHLGALLLAPLNIAWLLQGWLLVGATAYSTTRVGIPYAAAISILWLLLATALSQVVAWAMEAVRRAPRGLLVSRVIVGSVLALAAGVVATGRVGAVLDRLPTVRLGAVLATVTGGFTWTWLVTVLVLLVLIVGTVAAGVLPARWAARRSPRDEQRIETGSYAARRLPTSDFVALLRIDRGSVWRAVPLRRGLTVLALLPGLIALAGDLNWDLMTVLPGLVASGAALLFGVNAWCLDGRGGLWRDSLPGPPSVVFAARTAVLLEVLLVSSGVTVVLASLRAGVPSAPELSALLCTWVVVAVQVVALSMKWSVRNPYAVDLRSARATPAPPLVMVGYSARLALSTTVTGLIFSGLAAVPEWRVSVFFAVPFLVFAAIRLVRAHRAWVQPESRSRIIATTAA